MGPGQKSFGQNGVPGWQPGPTLGPDPNTFLGLYLPHVARWAKMDVTLQKALFMYFQKNHGFGG